MLALLFVVGSLAGADKSAADDAKEMRMLEGTWKIVSVDSGGRVQDKDSGPQQLVIKGDRLTLKMKSGDGPIFRFEVDPSQKPKAMDWFNKDDRNIGGIYALDGDELKLCFPLVPSERKEGERLSPGGFDTKDNPVIVMIAKREKE